MEGLTVSDAKLTVYIHPSMSKQIRRAILDQLSSLLFTYNEVFDGVLLAFEVHLPDKKARILPGLVPYFGVKLKATLLLFSPKPDMLIEGKVVKLGKDSVHATVLGFCSAAILLGDIREEFKYREREGVKSFRSKTYKHHRIKVGSIIRFVFKSMDEETLHISGSLLPPHTGCIIWLSKHEIEDRLQTESLKRHYKDIEKRKQIEDSGILSQADQLFDHGRMKKSRKLQKNDPK
ncbi:hypothetical protein HPP92_017328 [Vanilla planifolia]|uniref:DNA-directed RNA polymerase subunit n=1 Tax=Vanilla planifolia TaxID=51239 RepID=A0A835QL41_VANPL|nr:hypothetical protein HPP92_017328 [Vanilla planifolia]